MELPISIAAEPIFTIGTFVVTNALLTTGIVSLVLIIFSLWAAKQQFTATPKAHSLQNLLEAIAELFLNLYTTVIGEKRAFQWFPFLTTLFLFILFGSWVGLLPGVGSIGVWAEHAGEMALIPLLRAPTADLNTTMALAVVGMVFVQFQGFNTLGRQYLNKFFQFSNPINTVVGLLELIGEFTKVISFAFRLFGNIFAGEVLLAVMSFLIPVLASIPFLGLEIFVGAIQSLVFVMLILVFGAGALIKHH